jgi:pyruvate dehydrogenase (quinone)
LLGYGGAYGAINHADLLLMLGTDFPFSEFLPGAQVRKVQIDQNPKHIGRRTSLDLGLVGDVKTTLRALLENVREKTDDRFLRKYVAETESFAELKQHYVDKGPGIRPIRPEYLAATLCKLASDDAMFFADTGTAVMWLARHIKGGKNRRLFGSFSWASMANAAPNAFGAQLAYPGRQTIAICGDGGVRDAWHGRSLNSGRTQDTCDPHPTEQRIARLREYRAAGSRIHSLWSGI